MKLLFVDCCISQRGEGSRTKRLAKAYLDAFLNAHPGTEVETVTPEALLALRPFDTAMLDERDALAAEKRWDAPVFALARQLRAADAVVVATGGTSDMPVAEEAALTAEALGNEVVRLYDVGVAGLHRLLSHLEELMSANVIIAIAGMEGALASVIGGLADCPVIAVPTSIGYGACFHGLSSLLSMLNSCASGVSVVNIDNGFGAGYLASMINHMGGKQK